MANTQSQAQDNDIRRLTDRITQLEGELAVSLTEKDSLADSHLHTSQQTTKAAEEERSEWLRERDISKTALSEKENAIAAYVEQIAQLQRRIDDLQESDRKATSLASEVASAKENQAASTTKISELEIETLELREQAEAAEEQRLAAVDALRKLETDVTENQRQHKEAISEFAGRESEHKIQLDNLRQAHSEELEKAKGVHTELSASVQEAKDALAVMQTMHDD